MKVLITGANGQLGSELQITAPKNHELVAIDVDELDITNSNYTNEFIKNGNFDLIINAAAYTAVDKAESDEELAFAVNATGIKNIAIAAKSIGARVFHVSTDYVFNGKNYTPYLPEQERNPIGVYGKTKMAGEIALEEILPTNHIILRTAWLYSIHGNNFVKTMLKFMAERDELKIIEDQIGSPTSAKTLAETLWEFTDQKDIYGSFHWTNNGVASWYDFAVAIKEEAIELGMLSADSANLNPIPTTEYPTPAERPFYSVLDKTKSLKILNIKGTHWRCELRKVLKELQTNKKEKYAI